MVSGAVGLAGDAERPRHNNLGRQGECRGFQAAGSPLCRVPLAHLGTQHLPHGRAAFHLSGPSSRAPAAGTGLGYYRHVKIAGEDVVEEEPMQDHDLTIDALAGYDEETRSLYSGGLSDDPGPELAPMPEVE